MCNSHIQGLDVTTGAQNSLLIAFTGPTHPPRKQLPLLPCLHLPPRSPTEGPSIPWWITDCSHQHGGMEHQGMIVQGLFRKGLNDLRMDSW